MILRSVLQVVGSVIVTIVLGLLLLRTGAGYHWSRLQGIAWGAAGMLAMALVLFLGLQGWFLWNRAADGENAWICLHQPQAGCGIASPAPTPTKTPPSH